MLKKVKKHTDKLHQVCLGNYCYRTWHEFYYAKYLHWLVVVVFLVGVGIGLTPQILSYIAQVKAASGNIDSTDKYAYSENLGWINFSPTGGGVTVSDTGLTGYAWAENAGWINTNPTYGGVINDGAGKLSGYAWGENVGWINFNPTGSQVVITDQIFSGYAWGENTGWISFNCSNTNTCATVDYKVKTAWMVAGRSADITPPSSPTNVKIQAVAQGITLTWLDPSEADFSSIIILRGEEPFLPSGNVYSTVAKGRQSFTDTNITPGLNYKYIIRAKDSSGNTKMDETIYKATAIKLIVPVEEKPAVKEEPVIKEKKEEVVTPPKETVPEKPPEEKTPPKPKEETKEPTIPLVVSLGAGDLIHGSARSVYYYGSDAKKYLFPNQMTFLVWYDDFSQVKTITDSQLADIPFGGYVTYRPGVKMVKISDSIKVYAVTRGGGLRWIKNEALAEKIYGTDWNQKIDDLPIDIFNRHYTLGETITDTSQYEPEAQKKAVPDIKTNLGL